MHAAYLEHLPWLTYEARKQAARCEIHRVNMIQNGDDVNDMREHEPRQQLITNAYKRSKCLK